MSNFSKEKLNDLVVLLMSFLGHDHTVLPSKNKKVVAHFPFTLVVPALLFNLLFFCVFIAGCHWQAKNEQGDRVKKNQRVKQLTTFLRLKMKSGSCSKKSKRVRMKNNRLLFVNRYGNLLTAIPDRIKNNIYMSVIITGVTALGPCICASAENI